MTTHLPKSRKRSGILLLALGIPTAYLAAQPPPPALTTLYSFTGQDGDGALPYAALTLSSGGTLLGTTGYGGTYGDGTVFKLTPPTGGGNWTEAVLHSFSGKDGSFPYAGVIVNSKGVLFGTTTFGGAFGQGVVFQLAPPTAPGGVWTETVLHSFMGSDGAYPYAGLTVTASGTLYGTTELGGASNAGTVFSLTPPPGPGKTWTEAVLYSFTDGNDGGFPYGGLLRANNGVLYGTTNFGGANGVYGTVFELAPPSGTGSWTESTLYSFTGTGGGNPFGTLTMGASGSLYGTSAGGLGDGSGTVFKLQPPTSPGGTWTPSLLYTFKGSSDGDHPRGGVVVTPSGTSFGTTFAGGTGMAYLGYGTVFELTPGAPGQPWTETVLYTFTGGADGAYPNGALVATSNGLYYGTTLSGGTGQGTVFSLVP